MAHGIPCEIGHRMHSHGFHKPGFMKLDRFGRYMQECGNLFGGMSLPDQLQDFPLTRGEFWHRKQIASPGGMACDVLLRLYQGRHIDSASPHSLYG